MYEVFFIIIIASIVKFINRGFRENLLSHGTTLRLYQANVSRTGYITRNVQTYILTVLAI